jgi:hypothetical protein
LQSQFAQSDDGWPFGQFGDLVGDLIGLEVDLFGDWLVFEGVESFESMLVDKIVLGVRGDVLKEVLTMVSF